MNHPSWPPNASPWPARLADPPATRQLRMPKRTVWAGHTGTMNSPIAGSTRLHVASGSPFESEVGFSRALRIGDRVLVAGTAPIWADGHCPEDVAEQARRCLAI